MIEDKLKLMKKILLITLFSLGILIELKVNAQTDIIFYTTMGTFEVELYDTLQPITTGNFISLVEEEFYDGIIFHRVVEDFVIQGGDPYGTGFGGPGYTIEDEFDTLTSNVQKALGMANSGPNTGGSQFYINMVDNIYLDPNYPVFGIVTDSFEVVQAISEVPVNAADKPLTPVVMDSVRIKSDIPSSIIENIPTITIHVSPNPAATEISVSIPENSLPHRIRLINNSGQQFYEGEIITSNIIPVSHLQSGTYFIVVYNDKGNIIAVKKTIVSH